jgi:hypothetical protein
MYEDCEQCGVSRAGLGCGVTLIAVGKHDASIGHAAQTSCEVASILMEDSRGKLIYGDGNNERGVLRWGWGILGMRCSRTGRCETPQEEQEYLEN